MLCGVGDLGAALYTCGCHVRKWGATAEGDTGVVAVLAVVGGVGGLKLACVTREGGRAGDLAPGSGDGMALVRDRPTPRPPFML